MSPTHPRKEQLIAFGQGKLGDVESSQVESHLEECELCCETLLDLKDDTFVELVRLARSAGAVDSSSGPAVAEANPVAPPAATDGGAGSHSEHSATILLPESGAAFSHELPPELVDHPRYRIVGRVGQGGMGSVYRAEHRLMDRTVAVKLINPNLVRHPQAVERFRREVRAAARLSHPNIVAAYDAEQAGDAHFLVMEFVEGTDLDSVVKSRGPLPVAEACECIRQAAAGLQHAHDKGMVHRDIKPHNLMRAPDGQVRILDFGLAGFASAIEQEPVEQHVDVPEVVIAAGGSTTAGQSGTSSASPSGAQIMQAAAHLTRMGSVMGTPDYIAPEQAIDAHAADIRADIYSLGCTFFYLITGRPPFCDGNVVDKLKAHATQVPPSLSRLRKDVPAPVAEIVARMLAKKPADRFQTPAEVVDALAPWSKPPRVRSPRARRLMAAGWGLVAAILCGVIVIATDRGRLQIDSEVGNVRIEVLQGGEQVDIIDLQTGTQVRWLPTGEYELKVVGSGNDIALDERGFRMSRLGQVIVTASWSRENEASLKTLTTADPTITRDGVSVDDGGWKLTAAGPRTVRLFEIPLPPLKPGRFFYRAKVRSENVVGQAYLEMWARFPGQGEFFSKGLTQPVTGTMDWSEIEVPFLLEAGQQPDLVKLNVTIAGTGTVWIKDIELRGRVRDDIAVPPEGSNSGTSPFSRDRAAAEWIVDAGATLRVNRGGTEIHVAARDEIPTGEWQITEVCLYPQQFRPDAQLDHLAGLQQLRWMRLFNCQISDASLQQMRNLPNLRFLDLDFNTPTTDAGLAHIATHYPQLETLLLHGTSITDAGLAELARLPRLNLLNLTSTGITREGLRQLAKFPALTSLSLASTRLGDDDVPLLVDLPHLQTVNLTQTSLTDAAVDHLSKLVGLKSLQVRQTAITSAGLARLRAALPDCTIDAYTPEQLAAHWRLVADEPNWTPLQVQKATANGGATLRVQPDGSVVAEGTNPPQAIYTLEASAPIPTITALRLDVLRDESLPGGGPGRMQNGTFVLTGIDISYRNAPNALPVPLAWGNVYADYSQDGHDPALLPTGRGSWAIYRFGEQLRNQSLVMDLAEPLQLVPGASLSITLKHESFWYGCNLGRFRISATSQERPAPLPGQPNRFSSDAHSDLDLLQGDWIADEGYRAGTAQALADIPMQITRFQGNTLRVEMPQGRVGTGTVTLDESTSPRRMTLQVQGENVTLRAIYRIAGDRLTLCMNQNPAGPLPTEFESPAGSSIDMIVLRRANTELDPESLGAEERRALDAALAYLDPLDRQDYETVWRLSSSIAQLATTKEAAIGQFEVLRDTFGPATRRRLRRVWIIEEFPGAPEGRHAAVEFLTKFESRQGDLFETVLLNLEADGTWRGHTYAATLETLPIPGPASGVPRTPATSVPLGVNLVDDPSLEATSTGALYPTSWGTGNLQPAGSYRHQVIEGGRTGEHAWQIVGDGQFATVPSNRPPASVACRYAGSVWVQLNSGAAQVKLLYFDMAGAYIGENRGAVIGGGDGWQKLSVIDDLAKYPSAAKLSLALAFVGRGEAVFDDLELLAFDAAALPPDFESTYAGIVRSSDAVFNRFVGSWSARSEARPTPGDPAGRTIDSTGQIWKAINDHFLMMYFDGDEGRIQYLHILTFDQNLGVYRLWLFGSDGKSFERRGQWDADTQTLKLELVPPSPGVTGSSIDRFVSPDAFESSVLVTGPDGQISLDMHSSRRRVSTEPNTELPIANGPAETSAGFTQLDQFAGEWRIEGTMQPSVWIPDGGQVTTIERGEWILGGRFLRMQAFDEQGRPAAMWLATYEADQLSTHMWHFGDNGSTGQWRLTWDESSRGFHWRAIDMPPGWIGTGFNRRIDDDSTDSEFLIKDELGRVMMDLRQHKRRVR